MDTQYVTFIHTHVPPLPPFLLLRKVTCVIGHPFGHSGSYLLPVSPPTSWCTPASLQAEQHEEPEQSLVVCEHFSATTKTSVSYQHNFH